MKFLCLKKPVIRVLLITTLSFCCCFCVSYSQDSELLTPTEALKKYRKELFAFQEKNNLHPRKNSNQIEPKMSEIMQRLMPSIQKDNLPRDEHLMLAELYSIAKMYPEAIAVFSEYARGSDKEARENAKKIIDMHIEWGDARLGEFREMLKDFRRRFPHDKQDMLGLFPQLHKLINILTSAGHADYAITLIQDELATVDLTHPHYIWRLAVDMQKHYMWAGRRTEGLKELEKYKTRIKELVDSRITSRPEHAAEQEEYDSITRRFEKIVTDMEFAYTRGAIIGKKAPEIPFTEYLNTKPFSFDSLLGKIVVVDFWAGWCTPCIDAFPELRQFYETYKSKNVLLVGVSGYQGRIDNYGGPYKRNISQRDELSMTKKLLQRHSVNWPIVFSTRGSYDPEYGIDVIPRAIVIDTQGIVRFVTHTGNIEEIQWVVDKLIAGESLEPLK